MSIQHEDFSIIDHLCTSLSEDPATIAKSYEEENLLFKNFFTFRGGQNRQGCGSSCPARHLWNSSTTRFYLSCLSQPHSLLSRIWNALPYAQTPTWSPGVVELDALTGCQLTCFSLSDNKCHRPSCRVVSSCVQTLWFKRAGSFGKTNKILLILSCH